MHKVYRETVDIRVAFESAMKRNTSGIEQVAEVPLDRLMHEGASEQPTLAPSGADSEQLALPPSATAGGHVKRVLRPTFHFLLKLVKPLAAPFAFRLRRYLLDDVRRDLVAAVGDLHSTISSRLDSIERNIQTLAPQITRIDEYSSISVRRVAVNCGPDDTIIKTAVGYVLCASSDPALVVTLLEGGELERGTRQLIERLLRSGDTFVDVGANIGMHTLTAARAMRGSGKVIAFEPYGPTARRLRKTLWLNGFSSVAEVQECAVSDRLGAAKLHLGPTSGHHSLFDLGAEEGAGGEPVDVRLVTLDGTIGQDENVDLVKIDAEGAELEVLRGALKTINRNANIGLIVEFGPSHLKRSGQTPESWISAFTDLGFNYRAIHSLSGDLENRPLDELKAMYSANLFFARPQSTAWQKAQ